MWEFWLGYWWAVLIYGLAFGFVTKIVIKNKGYQEGKWFWWGFFFGVFAFQSLKSGRKGSPGLLSILPLPGSIFYPSYPSFLDKSFHRIRKNKMDQLSVFDKEALKNFYSCKRTLPFFFCSWIMGEMEQPMPKALDGH